MERTHDDDDDDDDDDGDVDHDDDDDGDDHDDQSPLLLSCGERLRSHLQVTAF